MPANFTKTFATPNRLAYVVTLPANTPQVITKAELIADCAGGPLRTLLDSISDGDWQQYDNTHPDLLITLKCSSESAIGGLGYEMTPSPSELTCRGDANITAMLLLEYVHSLIR